MANTYKDIVITPFRGDASNVPVIRFSSGDASVNSDMNVRFYASSNGTLSFEGPSGQMFSITNDMTGTIFSINDISGIPSMEVNASGQIAMAHFGGNVGIGTANAIYKLDVAGDARITGNVILGDASTDTITINGTAISLGNNQNIDAGTLFIDATNNRVGIGTISPTANLDVVGSIQSTGNFTLTGGRIFATGAGSAHLLNLLNVSGQTTLATTSGNVGIGTSSPTSNLHVIGTGNITTSLTVASINVIPAIQAAYNNANTKLATTGGTINGDLTIVGNLSLSGNTVFTNAATLIVSDPLIYLAGNNYSSDIVDIGFIANYVNTTGQNVHTGLFRDHQTKEYYLFHSYDQEPINNHIDPSGNNLTLAVLNSAIRTSNLVLGGANLLTTLAGSNTAVGTGANTYLLTTLAGANTAVGTGANAYATSAAGGSNTYLLTVIAGANTAVGSGANAYAVTVGAGANSYLLATLDGANSAVGTGANTVGSAAFIQANTAQATAVAAFDKANLSSGGASVAVSDAAPPSPTANSLWWSSDLGKLFVYYNDGSSNQWVETSPAPDTTEIFNTANTANNTATAARTIAGLSFDRANSTVSGFDQANLAFNRANAAINVAIVLDSVNAERYITFEDTTSGNATTANVSFGLKFTPSSNTLNVVGTIRDSKGDVRDLPVTNQIVGYGLSLADTGEVISTNTTVFVPNAVFFAGNAVSVYNNSSASITITQNSSVTMYLGGTATTGNRTLAQRGVATVLCVSANTFVISGAGLT